MIFPMLATFKKYEVVSRVTGKLVDKNELLMILARVNKKYQENLKA